MAYAIKRKPEKQPRESVLNKLHVADKLPHVSDTAREGAVEVKEKLKSDLSRMARLRRAVSLKHIVGCLSCDATGKTECSACAGTGEQKLIMDEATEKCSICEGSGRVSCVECMGTGSLPNVHRKKLIWMLAIGGLAWAFILFELWGGDILPEQRSKFLARSGGGGAVMNGGGSHGRTSSPHPLGGPANQPGTGAATGPAAAGVPGQPGLAPPGNGVAFGRR